jgi:hypothetical protein
MSMRTRMKINSAQTCGSQLASERRVPMAKFGRDTVSISEKH